MPVSVCDIASICAVSVKNAEKLKVALKDLLEDAARRESMAQNGKRIIEKNSGALARTIEKIEKYLVGSE